MPTKSKLVYLPSAQHDFEEIVKYHITEAGTPYARKIYSTMKTTINRLRDFPLMGQTHPDPILAANGYRKLVLTKTYVAVYKVIGDTVYIYAIVNGTTDYPPPFEVIAGRYPPIRELLPQIIIPIIATRPSPERAAALSRLRR